MRIQSVPRNGQWDLKDRLAGGHVERLAFWAAKGKICAEVFGDGNATQQIARRCDHINAGWYIGCFARVAWMKDAGGNPQVTVLIEAHSISPSTPTKVENQSLITQLSIHG